MKESTYDNFGVSQLIFGMFTTEVVNSGVGMNGLLIPHNREDWCWSHERLWFKSHLEYTVINWNSVKKVVVKSGSDKNVYMLAKSHLTLLFVQKAWWELAWDTDIGIGTACRLGYEVKSHIIIYDNHLIIHYNGIQIILFVIERILIKRFSWIFYVILLTQIIQVKIYSLFHW